MNEEISALGRFLSECSARSIGHAVEIWYGPTAGARWGRRRNPENRPSVWHVRVHPVDRRACRAEAETLADALGKAINLLTAGASP